MRGFVFIYLHIDTKNIKYGVVCDKLLSEPTFSCKHEISKYNIQILLNFEQFIVIWKSFLLTPRVSTGTSSSAIKLPKGSKNGFGNPIYGRRTFFRWKFTLQSKCFSDWNTLNLYIFTGCTAIYVQSCPN